MIKLIRTITARVDVRLVQEGLIDALSEMVDIVTDVSSPRVRNKPTMNEVSVGLNLIDDLVRSLVQNIFVTYHLINYIVKVVADDPIIKPVQREPVCSNVITKLHRMVLSLLTSSVDVS